MFILDTLFFQVCRVKKEIEIAINNNKLITYYDFCEDDFVLFDISELRKYLTEMEIKNSSLLNRVVKECKEVILLWNEKANKLPQDILSYTDFSEGKLVEKELIINRLYILKEKSWQPYRGHYSILEMPKDLNFKRYTLEQLVRRCDSVVNILNDFKAHLGNNKVDYSNCNNSINKHKITAKHHALTYLLELNALGKQVPLSDGGLAQNKIVGIGVKRIGKNGSGFVKAVRELLQNDLNSISYLKNVSNNWREIVLELSEKPNELEEYLKSKNM